MSIHQLTRIAAAAAILAIPTAALAAPDQNTQNGPNNGCVQWNNNGQCVRWNNNGNGNPNNGQWNNGQNNNGQWNGRHHHTDRDDQNDRNRGDRDDNGNYGNYGNYGNNGWNNGRGNNNGYGYGNANRSGQIGGTVSSFSPYNLYLNNGTHVELHNGTVINPTGTNLNGGQRVRVIGYWNQDGTFSANEIDVLGAYRRY